MGVIDVGIVGFGFNVTLYKGVVLLHVVKVLVSVNETEPTPVVPQSTLIFRQFFERYFRCRKL